MRRLIAAFAVLAGPARGQIPPSLKHPQTTPARSTTDDAAYPNGAVEAPDAELSVGDKAPNYQLDGSLGRPLKLQDLEGHWSVLVFDESRKVFGSLNAVSDSIRAMGGQQYGICRDGVGALRAYSERERLGFPLSDPTAEISQLFDMYDDENSAIQSGLVIVDAQGVVRMMVQGPSLHADDVLQMARHTIRGS